MEVNTKGEAMLITDEILRMAHIYGLYGSVVIHRLNGDEGKVIEIQRQIEKETDELRKLNEVDNENRFKKEK